jgi:hypothetical protein
MFPEAFPRIMMLLRRLILCTALCAFAPRSSLSEIVINEIHSNPDVKTEPVEFIELHNTGPGTVNLAGWRLTTAVEFTFPAGASIPAGGFVVVAEDPAALQAKFGAVALGPWAGRLANEGDDVVLRNASGDKVDEVDYAAGFPWPTVGDAPGYSIELIHPTLDNGLGGSWRASQGQTLPVTATDPIPAGVSWSYIKGIDEPSSPSDAWRLGTFDAAAWPSGTMPIGYDPVLAINTPLDDMAGNYSTVYLRTTFVVTNLDNAAGLVLDARYDDGFKVWINGVNVLNANASPGDLPYNGTSATTRESNAWETNSLPDPSGYLVAGTNVIAIQLLNTLLSGSSDCFLDLRLHAPSAARADGPTPGRKNAVFSHSAPPQTRQVSHNPNQPRSGEAVHVSAKVTDPDGVASVSLEYQVVEPGNYIELTDPAYFTNWTTVAMDDTGKDGDAVAGDDVFTATIPAAVQEHRRLIRYRITVADTTGQKIRVPYTDDPQPNFAYYVYDGVPAWSGAVNPASAGPLGTEFTVSSNEMNRLPVYQLISKKSVVEASTWFSRYGGDAYLSAGTLVYDGRVYDHVHYRARGGVWRYAMVKNMWKFDLNRGHEFQPRDSWGRKYGAPWKKLNLGACIQQGDFQHRGEQGMFESVGLRMFNLAGVPAPNTAYIQFRIVDEPDQAPPDQYSGDFWGLYLALEQEDGQLLDEHGLPNGNFYKMENGTGDPNNLGPGGPSDKSDLNAFLGHYTGATEAWWRTNLNLPAYLSYQTVVQGIHHYDVCYGKNYFYYRNPTNGIWQVVPWDLDLTWAENMYDANCGGVDAIKQRLLAGPATQPAVWREWQNRIREMRDLLMNGDEGWRLIDEQASLLRGPAAGPTLLDADRSQWDYNPKMSSSTYSSSVGKAGTGRYYKVGGSFNGAVDRMKTYLLFRATNSAANPRSLDSIAADAAIPQQPVIAHTGSNGFPVNRLTFRASAFLGANPFATMKWRVGEVSSTNAPSYLAAEPWKYEIEPVWESGELATYVADGAIPAGVLQVGHTYRARVRFTDSTGRASHWSAPVQFIAGAPDNAAALADSLRITELMYNPPAGSAYEFVELHNAAADTTLDLGGASFTAGISFTFPPDATLAPGAFALVVQADPAGGFAAFRSHYGIGPEVPVFGPYSGSLSDSGETVTLKSAEAGPELVSFTYGDSRLWPIAADGTGHSLVPVSRAMTNEPNGSLDYPFNWRASARINGSPGAADPEPTDFIVLNEIVAHTDYTQEQDSNDWIELHTPFPTGVILRSGWYLSDDANNLKKWMIPPETWVRANSYISFDEVTGFHNPTNTGFGLNKAGEQVFLSHLPGDGSDHVVDAVRFPAQENGGSWGRPHNSPEVWAPLTPRTRDAANANRPDAPRLTEIHFHPAPAPGSTNDNTRDEFIEITGAAAYGTNFSNEAGVWRIDGDVKFNFPAGFLLPANGQVLVVGFAPTDSAQLTAFRSSFGITNLSLPILGPWSGKLSNRSGQITLEKPQSPDLPGDPVGWVMVDETVFFDQAPWPTNADGSGLSLQLAAPSLPGTDPTAWIAAAPSPGVFSATSPDSDHDGLPDAWETLYGLDPKDPTDAALDKDLDGASNAQEFIAGTSPADAASVLRVQLSIMESDVVLRWPAAGGVAYEVQQRGSVATGTWNSLTNLPAAPAPGTNEVRAVKGSGSEVFRVRVNQ